MKFFIFLELLSTNSWSSSFLINEIQRPFIIFNEPLLIYSFKSGSSNKTFDSNDLLCADSTFIATVIFCRSDAKAPLIIFFIGTNSK